VVDGDVADALARSFLAELPAELAGRLRAEGERADYPAGTTVYRAGDDPQAALVVRGLIRVYLSSPGGRQVTVRYARLGDVLGIVIGARHPSTSAADNAHFDCPLTQMSASAKAPPITDCARMLRFRRPCRPPGG
jgi:CRP/FNR family cyclic AMP-dependent transcriptional regulator